MALNHTFPMVCDENFSYFQRFLRPIRDDYDENDERCANWYQRLLPYQWSILYQFLYLALSHLVFVFFLITGNCFDSNLEIYACQFQHKESWNFGVHTTQMLAFHIEWSDNSIAKTFTSNHHQLCILNMVICSAVWSQTVWICFIIHFLSSLFIVHVFFMDD